MLPRLPHLLAASAQCAHWHATLGLWLGTGKPAHRGAPKWNRMRNLTLRRWLESFWGTPIGSAAAVGMAAAVPARQIASPAGCDAARQPRTETNAPTATLACSSPGSPA
jgi:hypothetical protein